MKRRRLLAVTGVSRLEGGFLLRAVRLLRELAADWDISVVEASGIDPGGIGWPDPDRHEIVSIPPRPPWQPAPGRHPNRTALRLAVDRVLAARAPDAALLWIGAEYLAFGRGDFPPAVGDRIDCFTLDRLRYARHARSVYKRVTAWRRLAGYARYERRLVRRLAVTTVAAEDDARMLERLSGGGRVAVVPSGVTVTEFPGHDGESDIPTVAITGSLDHPPNVDAVLYFVRDLWPAIREEVGEARLLIAGRNPRDRIVALDASDGIELRANVPDMATVYRESWVCVAPMRSGAGIKVKVLEAWAAGRPAVLTPAAVGGLALDGEMRELVADGPSGFSELVIGLLRDRDRRHRYGRLAHDLASSRHPWDRCGAAISGLLREVSAAPHAGGTG